eukprot:CAMPEP_0198507122 /NCGR_PEP_ID=MMETSP1462-20131121/12116_1 /TAXON_ID=1333877 /ORGANISM="Brandtodinium nutriculum, Strain RCC3387" /LENGTH=82 /DNA_ID=CAMNT_0044236359 /DNA_START=222 /DNA_END=466 /DNA_ORIENTATION=+
MRGTPVASVHHWEWWNRLTWPNTTASLSVRARGCCSKHVWPARPRSSSFGALLPQACHEQAGRPRGHTPERRALQEPVAALR